MKAKITAFIDGLIIYDYILFGSVFALFILFIILAIVLRKKVALAVFLTLFSFIFLFVGFILRCINFYLKILHNLSLKKS